eukprot:TRINITY_DN56564_c0_g1_i1.p1 TRINITY_DN56564_c0_g1~~TRINITY_DN56564_c0_g1_i1.p1  ORF type:complete len:532 (+),score=86.94 TRINITY_DN56564_c0_g1_i1:76-1596(+)
MPPSRPRLWGLLAWACFCGGAALRPDQMEYCNSDFHTASQPPLAPADNGLELRTALVWIRHGARAPCYELSCWAGDAARYSCAAQQAVGWSDAGDTQRMRFTRAAPRDRRLRYLRGNCTVGQLVDAGIEQMLRSGRAMRSVVAPPGAAGGGLLPTELTQEAADRLIRVRATADSTRVMMSAAAYVQGLYPDSSVHVPIVTPDQGSDTMLDEAGQCPLYSTALRRLMASPVWVRREAEVAVPLRADVVAALGRPTVACPNGLEDCTFLTLLDCVYSHLCGVIPAEPRDLAAALLQPWRNHTTLAEAVVDQALWELETKRSDPAVLRTGVGRHLGEVVDAIDAALGPPSSPRPRRSAGEGYPRFLLFAGHDTSPLSALPHAFGVADSRWPPFAAQFALFLYSAGEGQGLMARVVLNGRVRVVPGCARRGGSGELCDWETLRDRLLRLRISVAACAPQPGGGSRLPAAASAGLPIAAWAALLGAAAAAAMLARGRRHAAAHVHPYTRVA